jgi:hypothetical protein
MGCRIARRIGRRFRARTRSGRTWGRRSARVRSPVTVRLLDLRNPCRDPRSSRRRRHIRSDPRCDSGLGKAQSAAPWPRSLPPRSGAAPVPEFDGAPLSSRRRCEVHGMSAELPLDPALRGSSSCRVRRLRCPAFGREPLPNVDRSLPAKSSARSDSFAARTVERLVVRERLELPQRARASSRAPSVAR